MHEQGQASQGVEASGLDPTLSTAALPTPFPTDHVGLHEGSLTSQPLEKRKF